MEVDGPVVVSWNGGFTIGVGGTQPEDPSRFWFAPSEMGEGPRFDVPKNAGEELIGNRLGEGSLDEVA